MQRHFDAVAILCCDAMPWPRYSDTMSWCYIAYGYVAAILCCGDTLQRYYVTSMVRWCVAVILCCSGDMLQLHCSDARLQLRYSNTMLWHYVAVMLCCSQVAVMPFWGDTLQWCGVAATPFCSNTTQPRCWEICYIYVTWMLCCRYTAANYFTAINSSDTMLQGCYLTAILQRYSNAAIHSSDTVLQWCDVTATLHILRRYIAVIICCSDAMLQLRCGDTMSWGYVAEILFCGDTMLWVCCSDTVVVDMFRRWYYCCRYDAAICRSAAKLQLDMK